jgi:hypothetical protein
VGDDMMNESTFNGELGICGLLDMLDVRIATHLANRF